ncbi:MAG: hypothetical protein Q8867_03290 [Bacteroidota bacterium]|nr:hypothetical protein [Bacteroidota bacterium]
MIQFFEKNAYRIFLVVAGILLVVLAIVSPGYYGGADNINHYFISHYAFRYPHLFLDPWGRPLFNILSFPFAYFGFTGLKMFNVLLGLITAWLVYLIARKLNLSQSSLAILFVIFTPMYCIMLLTGLTEILFSFVLVLAIYLFYKENYIASAIVISFLPFARNEGMVILPIFFLALMMRKKYFHVFFLLTGSLFMCFIGCFHYHDFFWIYTHAPYPLHHPIYKESGPLLHFFLKMPEIMGLPLLLLFITGFLLIISRIFSKNKEEQTKAGWEFWMILAPFGAYFISHSVLYWKALGGSMGLLRVLAGILPLGALVALIGYEWISGFLKTRWQKAGLFVITLAVVLLVNFRLFHYPFPLGNEEKTIKSTADWVKKQDTFRNKIYFNDLNVPFFLGIDPYDDSRCVQKWFLTYLNDITPGSLFVWDAHFGPNECQVPLDSLMLNPRFRLLKIFQPDEPATTLGGFNYEVYVFTRVPGPVVFDNRIIRDSLYLQMEGTFVHQLSKNCDFESACTSYDVSKLVSDPVHSPSHSYKIPENEEFNPGFTLLCKEVPGQSRIFRVEVSLFVNPTCSFKDNPTALVISLENEKESYSYHSLPLENLSLPLNQWSEVKMHALFPEAKSGNDKIKIYLWHKGKKSYFLDDMKADISSRE